MTSRKRNRGNAVRKGQRLPKREGRPSGGRGGGRSGAAGYDFQDIYIALQLAKLLIDDREPLLEVIWEKKALDLGSGRAAPVHVDDVVVRTAKAREIYVQVKASASRSVWSAARLATTGVLAQFWRQWGSTDLSQRAAIVLRLASNADVTPLAMLADAARRSRTPTELPGEASKATVGELRTFAASLSVAEDSPDLFEFLKVIHAEQLPDAAELDSLIVRSLAVFGANAPAMCDRLLRLVAESKHSGRAARSAHTRATLITRLREDGATEQVLIGAGLVEARRPTDPAFWDEYRSEVVRSCRTLRVYGLQVDRAVFADLPSLFVPLRLSPIGEAGPEPGDPSGPREPLPDRLFADEDRRRRSRREDRARDESRDLSSVLSSSRRVGLIGGPGSGKTTTLKWLAIISALASEEGRETRVRFGLSPDPLLPVFVRFRRLAQRVRERGLAGIAGRAALVAEFLAAEFEAGLGGHHLTKEQSLEIAQELLGSDRTLFLFDALDEVPDPEMRAALFDAVADMLARYPRPRVVLSSRPYAIQRDVSQLSLALFAPLPLDQAGRRTFARHWYRSVRTHLGIALSQAAAEAQAEDLASAAERMPDLAETPLLLSILALVHFNRQGLPVERSTLYDQATLAMLGHWERDPAGRDLGEDAIPFDWAPKLSLREREIRRVVECLAQDVQCAEGTGDFTEAVAVAALARGLDAVSPGAQPVAERGRLLLRLLLERSGLIQERSPGLLAFVHLSFQEYLAARAFIGMGEHALPQLAALSADGRHAEVLRLAVAILATDQRAESDERALKLIERVGERNALLGATCLMEAPRLRLESAVAERLARAALEDADYEIRHHMRAATTARAVWLLLEHVERADDLLLEFLSYSGGEGRRFPGEGEWAVAVLGTRPKRPFTPRLAWFLERLSDGATERSLLGSLATLLLVESGKLRAEEHIKSLVWVLSWPREFSETLEDRAATILRVLGGTEEPGTEVRSELRELVRRGWGEGFRAANLLLALGEALTPEIADVLVQALGWSEHEELCPRLVELARQTESRTVMIAALRRGLHAKDVGVQRGVARVLTTLGYDVAVPKGGDSVGVEERERSAALAALLADPASAAATLSALGDEVWDEDPQVAWQAVRSLIDAGRADVPGVHQALVRAGLRSAETRARAGSYLRELRAQPSHAPGVRAALLDGLAHEEGAVATASALLLVDGEDAMSERRLQRIVAAMMRDPAQIEDALPLLRAILKREPAVVAKAIGERLSPDAKNAGVTGRVACLLAASGQTDAPNLAGVLVKAGLSELDLHDEVIAYLRQTLSDPRAVTEARKALIDGLESDDEDVVWGAARCLWEAGIRTDRELPAALVGLISHQEPGASRACGWLAELLRNPWTTAESVAAAEAAIQEALGADRRDSAARLRRLEQAWRIAKVLVSIPACRSEAVVDATVFSGLALKTGHEDAIAILAKLASEGPEASRRIEDRLWHAVEKGSDDVGWGAIRALRKLFPDSFAAATIAERPVQEQRFVSIVRVLVREGDHAASQMLAEFARPSATGNAVQRALANLSRDEDGEVAFAAARRLVDMGLADQTIPLAIVKHGLGHWQRQHEAGQIVERLWSHPTLGPSVRYALRRATWGEDDVAACSAAILLMDYGVAADPGIVRGLTIGMGDHHLRRPEALRRLRDLLRDPVTRAMTLETLRVETHGEHPGQRFAVAALLVEAGAEFDATLLSELSARSEHWPHATLAVLAHSDRATEALEAAQRLGFSPLIRLLGSAI